MKNIKSILLVVCSFLILVSCSSSSNTESTNPTADLIIGNWKLIGYNDASGAYQSVQDCIKVFQKYEINGAFTLTADQCGTTGGFSGTWVKTAVANQYQVTQTNGTVDTAIIIFTENNTKYTSQSANGSTSVFQKQ
jgi:outer membrane biogenesis lipoprotein LolB